MSKANHAERHAKWLASQNQQGVSNVETTETINPSATNTKSVSTESDTTTQPKEGEKTGVFDLILTGPKFVYEKAILPAWNFVKGGALKVKDYFVNLYESEKALMESLGVGQYLLERGGKIGIGLLKIGATVTFAYFLSVYAMSNFGIALFAPQTLLIVGIAALVMIIASSVLAQKKAGAEVSMKEIGSHIVESVMAA